MSALPVVTSGDIVLLAFDHDIDMIELIKLLPGVDLHCVPGLRSNLVYRPSANAAYVPAVSKVTPSKVADLEADAKRLKADIAGQAAHIRELQGWVARALPCIDDHDPELAEEIRARRTPL